VASPLEAEEFTAGAPADTLAVISRDKKGVKYRFLFVTASVLGCAI
jgi:hypothetical protein